MKKQALISVSDKNGVADFARALTELGFELLSTGGTAKALRDAGLNVRDVADVTGFPEMMDGRVKTLHPAIHGGLLARRDTSEHMEAIASHNIAPIDLVCVNLYPFQKTVARADVSDEEAIENIDIGGPSMLRSGAKNFASVTVVVDPDDYDRVLDELKSGDTTLQLRRELATKVYAHTSAYDLAITDYLSATQNDAAKKRCAKCERFGNAERFFRRIERFICESAKSALRRKSASARRVLPRVGCAIGQFGARETVERHRAQFRQFVRFGRRVEPCLRV